MVTRPLGRAGKGTMGCLMTFAIFGAIVYCSLPVAQVFVRQYQFSDEMRTCAVLAPNLTNDVIRRRLTDKADALGLPSEAVKNLKIQRTGDPDRRINIDSEFSETVKLPGFVYTLHFTPHADQPL